MTKKELLSFYWHCSFFGIMAEAIIIQQKCVDTAKQTNPEKKASVYDMRFQKKWMEDCDEAEKIMIGKCAFKAYSATNVVCTVLAIVLAVCALLFDIGFCLRLWYALSGLLIYQCTARRQCATPKLGIKSPKYNWEEYANEQSLPHFACPVPSCDYPTDNAAKEIGSNQTYFEPKIAEQGEH